jgi:hypothetical protein
LVGEISFKTYNTRRNLPVHIGRKRGESNFLGAFLRSYVSEIDQDYFYGRHFAISECGVADFIMFRIEDAGKGPTMRHLMAFEVKLMDWRRALSQAYRYRYYADSSIVILPNESAESALKNRDLFNRHNIGLWIYDRNSGNVDKAISPSPLAPLSIKKREQALFRIQSCSIQFRKFGKNPKSLRNC